MSEEMANQEDDRYVDERTHWPQIIASILVAIAIVAITIMIVTSKFGNTPAAELEGREDFLKERQELAEERREAAEERREERAE
jgi:hypothetical protein